MQKRLLRCAAFLVSASLGLGTLPLAAQGLHPVRDDRDEVFAGSELESYLRVLQVAGAAPLYPWSVRAFSPAEVGRLAGRTDPHPWTSRFELAPRSADGPRLSFVSPTVGIRYNSRFPYGAGDGAVWAGRGLTTALQAGVSGSVGPVTLVLAPIAFRAENQEFEIRDNGQDGAWRFADGYLPTQIDLPQRFGDAAYTRIDPGQSTLRVDAAGVAVGVSTANQFWGPAVRHPMILGDNAPGFLHGFVGTSRPANLWIGTLHGRVVWGRLVDSPYTTAVAHGTARRMAGLVATFSPRGAPGVEVGGARFFHSPWKREIEASDLLVPFGGLFKKGSADPNDETGEGASNQLVSLFTRWVAPRSGFEVYGEYGREDHNWNMRDFLLEPDHTGGFVLGFRKVWRSEQRLVALRGEALNTRMSHLQNVRWQPPFYLNSDQQGHTHRGQVLGSPAAYGGSGSTLALDLYHPGGRYTLSWNRELRDHSAALDPPPGKVDVIHSFGGDVLLFRGRLDLAGGLMGVYNRDRDLGSDAFNLSATFGARIGL